MMIDNNTNWRNVCAIHETTAGRPARIASGKLINAIVAKI